MIKKHLVKLCVSIATAMLLLSIFSSCIKEEYDMKEFDKTISIGGKNLILPLGETDTIRIDSIFDSDVDFLQKIDGAYAFRLKKSLDYNLSEKLPDLKEKLKINGINVDKDIDFSLGSFDINKFNIPGINQEKSIAPGFPNIDLTDIKIPTLSFSDKFVPGMGDYKPSDSQMEINDINLSLPKMPIAIFKIPSADLEPMKLLPSPVSIPEKFCNAVIPQSKNTFSVEIILPEGVSNIDNIVLEKGAQLTLEVEIINSVFEPGASVATNILFDPSEIFGFGTGVSVPLVLDKPLNGDNGYKASYRYDIESLLIDKSAWVKNKLTLTSDMSIEGNVAITGAKVNTADIENINKMGIKVTASITKLKVLSVDLDIPTVNDSFDDKFSIDMDPYKLPSEVKGIGMIDFKPGSSVKIKILKENMASLNGLSINIPSFELQFPPEFVVEGADAQNIVKSGPIAISGNELEKELEFIIKGVDLSKVAPASGQIALTGDVKYKTSFSISGRVSTKDLPFAASDNAKVKIEMTSDLDFDKATITTNDIRKTFDETSVAFSVEMPDGDITKFGKISILPDGNPEVSLAIALPNVGLDIAPGTEGMTLAIPEIFSFKNVPSEYNYDKEKNTITLKNTILPTILLPIDKISAQIVERDNKNYLEGIVSVMGDILVKSGTISTDAVSDLKDKTVDVTFSIPALTPGSISLEALDFDIEENITIPIKATVPELYSINYIMVSGAEMSLDVNILNIPDLGGAPLDVDFDIDFPDRYIFEDTRVDKNNVMHIAGRFENNSFSISPVKVKGIKFDGKPLNGELDIEDIVAVKGKINVTNPSVNMSSLDNKNVSLNVNAAVGEFYASELSGKIDYTLDPVNESLRLDDIPSFLKSDDCVLDLENPHIALTLNSNVGIPVAGELTITPYFGETANMEGIQNVKIRIPKCDLSETSKTTLYWIAKDKTGMPSDYTFVESNLANLIKKIPDRVDIKLNAKTDLGENHYIDVNTDYKIEFTYDLVVPLQFGKDMKISLRDTLKNIPKGFTSILKNSKLGLAGTIENTLPLQLELEISAIDANENLLPVISNKQTISACNSDGSATKSELDISLKATSTDFEEIYGIILDFKVTSPNLSGIPVTDKSYVLAVLKVAVDGGLTLDLSEFNSENDNGNGGDVNPMN